MYSNVSSSCVIILITRGLFWWWSRSFLDHSEETYLKWVCACGSFPYYMYWDSGNHLWLCDLMGAEMAVSISKSSVESWVGCDMFAETMGACTHVSTSQDGINAFGVKQLGGVIYGISTFNSTQCYIHGWFLWSIHTWMKSMDLCMWELGVLNDSYVKNLGTIRDYVIWWELRMLYQSVNRQLSPGWDAICLQRQWEPVRMYLHRRMVSTRLVLNS